MNEARAGVDRLPSSLAALVCVCDWLSVTEVNGEVFRRFRGWSSSMVQSQRGVDLYVIIVSIEVTFDE